MPEVDYEQAWHRLKVVLTSKPSHGARDLALEMTRIEVACAVPDEQRGFDPSPPARSRPRVVAVDG